MKNKIFFLILLINFSACNFSKKSNNNEKILDKTIIDNILNKWHAAAKNSNFNLYFSLMDQDAIFVGTDSSEIWNKKEFMNFAKPFFDKKKAWNFKKIKRNIYFDKDIKNTAWLNELLDTKMGICRGSGVLIKKNNKWFIKHYVLSMTIPNDKIKSVLKIIK